ncbi:MAG: CueP family metal-binding protein [Propionibacteriaceae bacterium]|nr:CueP family metal-binding protein [Propionibacteriaceae bacterium]
MNRLAALVAVPLIAIGGLTACSSDTPVQPASTAAADSLVDSVGLAGKSGREIIETLDQDATARPLSVMGSVRYDELILSDGTNEQVVPIEGDEFYLSMAPYETFTHDCYFHNVGTCQGELAGEDVHVTITTDDGEVLVDEDATTYANGFVGFWIPKDKQGTIVVTKDGKTAESPFSSDAEGATCVTTLPLV